MNYILFDGPNRNRFLPLTFTRPVADLRIGILTIKEKWENYLGTTCTVLTEEYLEEKFPMVEMEKNIFIDASVLPTADLVEEIEFLSQNEMLVYNDFIIAFFAEDSQEQVDLDSYDIKEFKGAFFQIENKQDLFLKNDKALRMDFQFLSEEKTSEKISKTNQVIAPENIFIEKGAVVEFATLNASTGPIYISKNSLIMEGSMVRGPFYLGENSVVKMGAKIYGATTIGPNCTIGGELKNVVFIGNSNKGHEGYLGDSVIGEWCNFGADTNCSNVKNNFSTVRVWDYETEQMEDSETMKFGIIVGDHSKTGINTMLNTGSVLGVFATVFGADFPEKYVPSFSWGSSDEVYNLEKALEAAKIMYGFKNATFTEMDKEILTFISENFRKGIF